MTKIDEIAADVFRICCYDDKDGFQFSHFLIRDREPLLYHTGDKKLFPQVLHAVQSLIDVTTLRWVAFSHYESDECGSLNAWLACAPRAQPVTGFVQAETCINNDSDRAPRVLEDGAIWSTGRHALQMLVTPYVPHDWCSTLLFDTTERVLFVSDLFSQRGNPPVFADDMLPRSMHDLKLELDGPFHDAVPYTGLTHGILTRLADLKPKVIAPMHGSCFRGDGAAVMHDYDVALRALVGAKTRAATPA